MFEFQKKIQNVKEMVYNRFESVFAIILYPFM